MNIIDAIDQEARALPRERQHEVLAFILGLREQRPSSSTQAWLEQAWGSAPDFPDRPPQPPLTEPAAW